MKVRNLRWRFYRKTGGGPHIGNRCKEDLPGCPVCDAWAFKDRFGRFPYSYDELAPYRRTMVWVPAEPSKEFVVTVEGAAE